MSTETTGAPVVQTLHENSWVSLKIVRKPDAGVNGYVFSHETRCAGRIVAVLPYRETASGREYLIKSEMTPCWGFGQVRSAITGGYEGGDIEDDAVREMLEETGYAITRDELIPLGESFASKSSDTVYTLFSADLTGREAGEAIGDGSRLESESAAVWVTPEVLAGIRDPQVHVMFTRLRAEVRQQAGATAGHKHEFPVQPPEGSWLNPGACRVCGVTFARVRAEDFRKASATVPVESAFLRQVLTDAIRACEADVMADGDAMQGLLAEYRAELAGLPEVAR